MADEFGERVYNILDNILTMLGTMNSQIYCNAINDEKEKRKIFEIHVRKIFESFELLWGKSLDLELEEAIKEMREGKMLSHKEVFGEKE